MGDERRALEVFSMRLSSLDPLVNYVERSHWRRTELTLFSWWSMRKHAHLRMMIQAVKSQRATSSLSCSRHGTSSGRRECQSPHQIAAFLLCTPVAHTAHQFHQMSNNIIK